VYNIIGTFEVSALDGGDADGSAGGERGGEEAARTAGAR
jgi:hypothetical protein